MGYNQDALASFLATRRPLELIHRTKNRDYAYTRGRNKGSFNNSLMEAHRNHIHIAMDDGGILPVHLQVGAPLLAHRVSQALFRRLSCDNGEAPGLPPVGRLAAGKRS